MKVRAAATIVQLAVLGTALAAVGGCAAPEENAGVERQTKDEFMQGLRCRGNRLPVCVERMGKIVDCQCANSVEFDRIFDR